MEDGRAILEATRTETALLAGTCDGGGWALMLAATQPATALGVVAIAPRVPHLTPSHPNYRRYPSLEPLDADEGWAEWNVHYWRRDYPISKSTDSPSNRAATSGRHVMSASTQITAPEAVTAKPQYPRAS